MSFGRKEEERYEWWIGYCKEQNISKSCYLKNKIREDRNKSKLVSV